jgi:4-amino-4-deoxy-L-arabinose transferase-like glycosyltransferase
MLALIGILLLAFYLRWTSASETSVLIPLRADAQDYFMYAYNLRHKHVYSRDATNFQKPDFRPAPDAARSPGYPIFLSAFVSGFPNKDMIDRIVLWQALLSTITILFSFLFFRTFLSVFWAGAGTLLTALSPHLIVASSYILTETLFCFFLVLSWWLLGLLGKRLPLLEAAVIGMLMAIASLVRPSLQYFPVFFSLFLVLHFSWRKGGRLAGILILGFALCLSPWVIRNVTTLGVTSDKTLMINFLHHGMYRDFTYDDVRESRGFPYRYDPRASEISRDLPSVLKEIWSRFEQEPIKHLQWFLIGKPVAFWSWNTVQGVGDAFIYPVSQSPYFESPFFRWSHRFMHLLHWPLVILASFGCLMAWFPLLRIRVSPDTLFMVRVTSLLLIYYTALHMIGAPFPRYSIPLRPFLYGLALFTPQLLFLAVRSRCQG